MALKYWATALVLGLLMASVSIVPSLAEQMDEDDPALYDDYYDENELPEPTDQLAEIPQELPYFEQSQLNLLAAPGSDALLNCDVRNFHVNNVVIWYRDSSVIVQGQFAMSPRYKALKNNSILIENIIDADAGNYHCVVEPQNVTQYITLMVEKDLTIVCDGNDVLDRTIIYREGESHRCECRTPGAEGKHVKWFHNGQRPHVAGLTIDDSLLSLHEVSEHHAGIYQCLDDDGSAQPKNGKFQLTVHAVPKVTTHRHHVNTEMGGTAELYCDYRGDPIAIARWLKNGQELGYTEKHMITYSRERHMNRSTLLVRDVNAEDLGEYICRAENVLGANELGVHLMLEPEKGQFENILIDGNIVTLAWLVRSLQPLSEAVLDYKMKGSFTWSSTTVLHTQRHEDGVWKIVHEMQLLPGEWQTKIKTKNTIGWSKFSEAYIFVIEDQDASGENVSSNNDRIAMAGFATGDSNRNSSAPSFSGIAAIPLLLVLPLLRSIVEF